MSRWEFLRQRFLKDIKVQGFTLRSQESYRGDLDAFLSYLDQERINQPADVTLEILQGYQTYLFERMGVHGRRLTMGTQAHHLATVRTFFGYLYRRGHVLMDPTRLLAMPRKEKKLPAVILTPAEVSRLLRAIDTRTPLGVRDRAIFETLYSTGMRVSELAGLLPEDVDLEEGFVRIRQGKGQKGRVVPLGRIAGQWIRRYLEQARPSVSAGQPLFVSWRRRRLDRGNVSVRAKYWAKRAQIDKRVTPHVFRHSCATHMLKGKASLRHIQALLGHEDPNSTQIYTHVEIADLKKIHEKCHPRGRG